MPKYKNNQIVDMLCQIRFSTVLRINNESDELLSVFQEKLKDRFPNYQIINENSINVEMGATDKNMENITPQILRNNVKNHMFISESGNEKVNLTCNFLSLSTKKYESWDTFKDTFKWVLDIFNDVYKINNYNRIGLRYVNAFSKSELGIAEDEQALQQISTSMPEYNVIGIPSIEAVRKGGALNCISWDIYVC